MEEIKKEEQQEDLIIKTIKEEYERKIKELEEKHKAEIENVKKECEDRTVRQIKSLMAGRDENLNVDNYKNKNIEPLDFYEDTLEKVRKNFKLNTN